MQHYKLLMLVMLAFLSCSNRSQSQTEKSDTTSQVDIPVPDYYDTPLGELKITVAGHASLVLEYADKVIHVDPWSKVADYSRFPKADLLLITHEHQDHFDKTAIDAVTKSNTRLITTQAVTDQLGYGEVIYNGSEVEFGKVTVKAVPAFNIVHKRPDGEFYHPKGRGNGYVLSFAGFFVYVAADTENIPEMSALKGKIDIAFLPKNIPYTMTDEMFTDAALKIMPKFLYPYHMNSWENEKMEKALAGSGIKMVVKEMNSRQ